MFYEILTSILFSTAIVPPALVQYYAFSPWIKAKDKSYLFQGYFFIYSFETLLCLQMFAFGPWDHNFALYRKLLYSMWIPYFIWSFYIIKGSFFSHLYVLTIRMTCAVMISTILSAVMIYIYPQDVTTDESSIIYPLFTALYIILFLALLPILRHYFNDIFSTMQYVSNNHDWKYVSFLSTLLFGDMIFYVTTQEPLDMYTMLLPRLVLCLSFLSLALSLRAGLRQTVETLESYKQHDTLIAQMQHNYDYTQSLLTSQKEIQEIYKKRKTYLDQLEKLISSHQSEEALHYIEKIGYALNKTKRKFYCKNVLINAALASYLGKAEALHIPTTVQINIPNNEASISSDLAIVLSNLMENAINASQQLLSKDPEITLLARQDGDMLNILIKNRFDGSVIFDEDGFPTTEEANHGIGMKSILHFKNTWDASIICTCEDGYFSTYIHLPWVIKNTN